MRLSALFRSSVPIFTILSLCCFFCEIFQVKALSNVMNRRSALINSCASCIPFILPMSVNAAETIGKDPNCNGPSCLGVWDGLLADCPHGNLGGSACVSSQGKSSRQHTISYDLILIFAFQLALILSF